MSALTTIVRRFGYPAQSPLASLTLYYTLLVAVSALLLRNLSMTLRHGCAAFTVARPRPRGVGVQ